jgi:hypothetical protein
VGIGGFVVLQQLLNRHDEEDWCDKNHCQCPCHQELPPWYFVPLVILAVLAAVLVILWIIITLVTWVDPYPKSDITLVQVLKDQWEWLKHLLGRVW